MLNNPDCCLCKINGYPAPFPSHPTYAKWSTSCCSICSILFGL